jgi:hypothetical protein
MVTIAWIWIWLPRLNLDLFEWSHSTEMVYAGKQGVRQGTLM